MSSILYDGTRPNGMPAIDTQEGIIACEDALDAKVCCTNRQYLSFLFGDLATACP
jgi:hypothetical protein